MTSDLKKAMANLSVAERDRLEDAFAADPELAEGLKTMLADLPHDNQEQIVSRVALRLTQAPLGGGAVIAALTDVIVDTLQRSEREDG